MSGKKTGEIRDINNVFSHATHTLFPLKLIYKTGMCTQQGIFIFEHFTQHPNIDNGVILIILVINIMTSFQLCTTNGPRPVRNLCRHTTVDTAVSV
jgi:hypothetical protein